jgi:rod shape determining protein RodA
MRIGRTAALLGRMNLWMTLAILGLMVIGVLFIYSACYTRLDVTAQLYQRQMLWVAAGLGCYLGATLMDYRRLRDFAWWFFVMAVILLVAVLVVGTRIYGARRWLMLFGVGIQPSELAKLGLVLAGTCLIVPSIEKFERAPSMWWSFGLALVPMLLIVRQPDLGSALVFIPIIMAMLFAGGAPWRPLALLVGGGAIVVMLVMAAVVVPDRMGMAPDKQDRLFQAIGLSAYQRDRIEVFLQPGKDPMGAGWNRRQSEIAVGSGGLTGKGYLQGTQNVLGYLPKTVAPTDFIFSVIAEELGFAGSALVLGLFAIVVIAGLHAAVTAADRMGQVLCVGVVTMVFSHVLVNVAMTVGLMPIVGIPLPLISYGGSFMVSTLLGLGLVQSVYVRRPGP